MSKEVPCEAHSRPTDDLSGGGGPPRCLLDGIKRSGKHSIFFRSKTAAKNRKKSVQGSNHPNAALTLLCRGIDRNQLAQLSCYGPQYSLARGGTVLFRVTASFPRPNSKKVIQSTFFCQNCTTSPFLEGRPGHTHAALWYPGFYANFTEML